MYKIYYEALAVKTVCVIVAIKMKQNSDTYLYTEI